MSRGASTRFPLESPSSQRGTDQELCWKQNRTNHGEMPPIPTQTPQKFGIIWVGRDVKGHLGEPSTAGSYRCWTGPSSPGSSMDNISGLCNSSPLLTSLGWIQRQDLSPWSECKGSPSAKYKSFIQTHPPS